MPVTHLTFDELRAGLDHVRDAPRDEGTLQMIVRRPNVNAREVLDAGELSLTDGLVGDTWRVRGSSRSRDGKAHPEMQLNIMGVRAVALVAQTKDRWPLAGDQLFVDLDLSATNLPPGTRLSIGTAIVEVTTEPHLGCRKFVDRFGLDAMKFVNSPVGRALNLRGINARVVQPGVVRAGDAVRKVASASRPEDEAAAASA
jgi:hypothetical protein